MAPLGQIAASFLAVAGVQGTTASGQEAVPVESAPVTNDALALEALNRLDFRRLQRERRYAEEILAHLDWLLANRQGVNRVEVDRLRMFALVTAERRDEARALAQAALAAAGNEVRRFQGPWFTFLRLGDDEAAVSLVEQARRDVRSPEWTALRDMLDRPSVWGLLGRLLETHDDSRRARLARALLEFGWPGDQDRQAQDSLRTIVMDELVAQGAVQEASSFAGLVATPEAVLPLLVQRKYDVVMALLGPRERVLEDILAAWDRETAAAVAAAPASHQRILERAQFLRSVARVDEALSLLTPFVADVAATVAADDQGMWLVQEAAYALFDLGRRAESVRLSTALAAFPLAERPALISVSINHASILWQAGDYQRALDHALSLTRSDQPLASNYGMMWIYSVIVCSLSSLGRNDEIAPWLTRLRAGESQNGTALSRTYLCLNNLDAAEALMLRRLQGSDAATLLVGLQDYSLTPPASNDDVIDQRRAAVRNRPAVRAAIERVGRVMTLPLSSAYWISS